MAGVVSRLTYKRRPHRHPNPYVIGPLSVLAAPLILPATPLLLAIGLCAKAADRFGMLDKTGS